MTRLQQQIASFSVAISCVALWIATAAAQTMPGGGGRMPPGYGGRFDDMNTGPRDFPLAPLAAAVDANVRYARARAMVDRAETTLNNLIRDEQATYENSAGYKQAMDAEVRAFNQLNAARAAAIAKIADDAGYKAAVDLRGKMTQQIAERREMLSETYSKERDYFGRPIADYKRPFDEIVVAMAVVKLGFAASATAMEVMVEAQDPAVRDARARLMDAGSHVRDLNRAFADRVRTDPTLVAARKTLDDAKVERLIASTVQEGAIAVADAALDYAYYSHSLYSYNNNSLGYDSYSGLYGGLIGGFAGHHHH